MYKQEQESVPAILEAKILPSGAVFATEFVGLIVPRVPNPKVPPSDSGTLVGKEAPAAPPF